MDEFIQIDSLEDKLAKEENLLSAVTGLPIAQKASYPSDPSQIERSRGLPSDVQTFLYNLLLSDDKDSYSLNFEISHVCDTDLYVPHTKWSLKFNGKEISRAGFASIGSDAFYSYEITPKELRNARLDIVLSQIRGICIGEHEMPFMDYENYTLESLEDHGRDSYFKNIYLLMMCHLKERGLQMPPIISKDPELYDAMVKGDTAEVGEILGRMVPSLRLQLDDRCYKHVVAEAKEIRNYALEQKKWFSQSIPFTEKICGGSFELVPGEPHFGRRYNIITVENDLHSYGEFTDKVMKTLKKSGTYGGSAVWKECNLPYIMELCSTGQVDMILFDWRRPSYEELMMFKGDSPAGIGFDESGSIEYHLQDGSVKSTGDMAREAEETMIRDAWMDRITSYCQEKGVVSPPYFVVLYEAELKDAAKIISQKLGNSFN